MDESIQQLPFDQLRTLHREIGALIAERRAGELERIRNEIGILGFSPSDLIPPKVKGNGKKEAKQKYRDPDNPENTYGGKGPKPQWLKDALEEGRELEDFAIAS